MAYVEDRGRGFDRWRPRRDRELITPVELGLLLAREPSFIARRRREAAIRRYVTVSGITLLAVSTSAILAANLWGAGDLLVLGLGSGVGGYLTLLAAARRR